MFARGVDGMLRRRMTRRPLPLLALALVTLTTARARAIGIEQYHEQAPGTGGAQIDDRPASERRVTVTLDTVLGWGNGSIAQLVNARSSPPRPITVIVDKGRYVESFLPSVQARITREFSVGVMLPFTFMSFTTDDGRRLGAAALGNLIVGGAWSPASTPWTVSLALGAPTAQGTPPSGTDTAPLDASEENGINRLYAQDGAARSRGLENLAPWAYKRWSLTPKLAGAWTLPSMPLTLGAALQVENLIDAGGGAPDKWALRTTPSVRASWSFGWLDASLRSWVAIPITRAQTADGYSYYERGATWAVEPSVRASYERISGLVGVIVPVAKPAGDPRYFGLRLVFGVLF